MSAGLKRFREIERELKHLATLPNVQVFASEHDARRAEAPRLVTRIPSERGAARVVNPQGTRREPPPDIFGLVE
jgi:hypothetical protein